MGEARLSRGEPLRRQGPEGEKRRGLDRLLHVCLYCLDATDPEIYSIYFCLTPFVCEYNIALSFCEPYLLYSLHFPYLDLYFFWGAKTTFFSPVHFITASVYVGLNLID